MCCNWKGATKQRDSTPSMHMNARAATFPLGAQFELNE